MEKYVPKGVHLELVEHEVKLELKITIVEEKSVERVESLS
jgi:hypothetical protein